ncbi:MAG: putative major capsid protein [Prokaryotic dsDNA virus sp.]|nr:hypothetical protein [Flavobacteriaceae bacterium]QDP65269.1 MAG: putative major capsid protein [Prokaryotic dsDNA virus sp.]|tara:strand:+ start:19144 stop:20202 length:1059 start_codon:yes stop_codon:yes gene_type:complete
MAAGPTTRVSDLVVPEVFTPYTQVLTEEKSRLVQSGLLARSEALDNLLSGGGITFQVPSFRDLDNDEDRVSTDTSVPFADADASLPAGVARPPDPRKILTQKEIAVRLNRNNSWSSSDLAAILAGADPMQAIANRVASYWARRLQAAFIATWNGVIADNTLNDSGDYVNDISGASFVDGVTNFSAEAFLDAAQTMGDSQEDLVAVAVHSVVYNRMQKNNLIDFIPDARGEITIPTFLGREVIVDDGLPRTGSVYDTWIFGSGATQFGVGTPPVATEVDRKPGGGNGGGQDVLYSRVMWTIHPTGHAWVGTAGDGGPANTGTAGDDLDEASSWNRVYPERKQIKFARLVTREA